MSLPNDCKSCEHRKFRVVSMVLRVEDAGNQCHHPFFQEEYDRRRVEGDKSIINSFKKIDTPEEIPEWCPLRK